MDEIYEKEMEREIDAILSEIPENERVGVVMHVMGGFTLDDTGFAIGRKSRERARQICERGLRMLRHPARIKYLEKWMVYVNERASEASCKLPKKRRLEIH